MNRMSRTAGALMLALVLGACGGGNSGNSDSGISGIGSSNSGDSDATVGAAAPAAEMPAEVAVTDDPSWVPTWNDADLDAYYPSRPIKVAVDGLGTVGNSVLGVAGPLSCVQGGSACSVSYPKYVTIRLSAVPRAGQSFRGWGGACVGSGTDGICVIRNYMLHNVTASFSPT